ncbi:polysaccharide pyruvyl transferase family protein [Megasphaera massiliensis]|uniref:polysaccharide pyruvyl transferase family protein n=1 Tax=Megasphaera massiliensis TaxID=1232428 RepID=UPI00210E0285|nr:polysaccharide pyruvyl transferase family protein [Megasphaera massiliensis]MCQ5209797.1 polysaccharide pyruvyl transferase family protein [Megasphaera massiliensis]
MYIGKITLDGYFNYGNLLQNYALQQVLLHYAERVDTLWHTEDNFLPDTYWNWGWKEPIKYLINWKGFRSRFLKGNIGREMVRHGKLRDWAERYIHFRKDIENLHNIADEYDYFVTGSDQVWNPYFPEEEYLKANFLSFAPSEKRLSYAASISAPDIPENRKDLYKNGFDEMHRLSLREQAGAELVQQISGRKAEVHVDPTLLLTTEEWDKVSRIPAWYHGEKYILTYFLGERPDEVIQKTARDAGLSVVNLLDANVYEHYVTGVDEFIWAIKHASLVYTDSFHGTVFSILYRTPFVVCNRLGNSVTEKMGSRIDSLLGLFGLENRRGTSENGYAISNPTEAPDWSDVDAVLDRERNRSKNYFDGIFHRPQ